MYFSFVVDREQIPQLLTTIAALFAKSSLIWPALLNIMVNKKYLFKKKKHDSSSKSPQLFKLSAL